MKLCRFVFEEEVCCGILDENTVYPIRESDFFDSITPQGKGIPVSEIIFLCPTEPKNIFAIGLNYKRHAEEMDMGLPEKPLMFLKAVSSLTEHNSRIVRPYQTRELSCEAELAIVIRKTCKNVPIEKAGEYLCGYSMINDVTARDIQRSESQWMRAKSFDTFCPYGPIIETDLKTAGRRIRLYVDDRTVQDSTLDDMIFSPEYILSYVSQQCTLYAGDVIATGTPGGVTTVYPGEKVTVEINGIGKLCNTVVLGDEKND